LRDRHQTSSHALVPWTGQIVFLDKANQLLVMKIVGPNPD